MNNYICKYLKFIIMAFWILKKNSNTPYIGGSITKTAELTNININQLYEHFSRKKNKDFENDEYIISKQPVQRTKRKPYN